MILIYYGNEIDKKAKIKQVVETMNLSYIEIGDSELEKPLKEIQKSSRNLEGRHPLFLYFREEAHQTVQEFEKRLGFTVPRKAMQNEFNQNWRLMDLMNEISEEAEYFALREHLYDLIRKADMERMKTDEEYSKLMSAGYGLFEQDDVPKDLLTFAIELIEKETSKK